MGCLCVVPEISAQIATDGTDMSKISAGQVGDLLQRAQSGDVQAQLILARALDSGSIARADPLSAAKWACEAASQGSIEAQVLLSSLYGHLRLIWVRRAFGLGVSTLLKPTDDILVPVNEQKAFFWITLAVQHLPKWDPDSLDKNQKKTLTSAYNTGADPVGSPVRVFDRERVIAIRDRLAKQLDFQTVARIGEEVQKWLPNSARPWKPSTSCLSAPGDADANTSIARIRGGQYSPLPPAVVGQSKALTSGGAALTFENNTGYQIVVYLSGPTEKAVMLESNSSRTVELNAGQYRIGVETPSASFMPFYGEQNLSAGSSYHEMFSAR